jgi:hypothetical protein
VKQKNKKLDWRNMFGRKTYANINKAAEAAIAKSTTALHTIEALSQINQT